MKISKKATTIAIVNQKGDIIRSEGTAMVIPDE